MLAPLRSILRYLCFLYIRLFLTTYVEETVELTDARRWQAPPGSSPPPDGPQPDTDTEPDTTEPYKDQDADTLLSPPSTAPQPSTRLSLPTWPSSVSPDDHAADDDDAIIHPSASRLTPSSLSGYLLNALPASIHTPNRTPTRTPSIVRRLPAAPLAAPVVTPTSSGCLYLVWSASPEADEANEPDELHAVDPLVVLTHLPRVVHTSVFLAPTFAATATPFIRWVLAGASVVTADPTTSPLRHIASAIVARLAAGDDVVLGSLGLEQATHRELLTHVLTLTANESLTPAIVPVTCLHVRTSATRRRIFLVFAELIAPEPELAASDLAAALCAMYIPSTSGASSSVLGLTRDHLSLCQATLKLLPDLARGAGSGGTAPWCYTLRRFTHGQRAAIIRKVGALLVSRSSTPHVTAFESSTLTYLAELDGMGVRDAEVSRQLTGPALVVRLVKALAVSLVLAPLSIAGVASLLPVSAAVSLAARLTSHDAAAPRLRHSIHVFSLWHLLYSLATWYLLGWSALAASLLVLPFVGYLFTLSTHAVLQLAAAVSSVGLMLRSGSASAGIVKLRTLRAAALAALTDMLVAAPSRLPALVRAPAAASGYRINPMHMLAHTVPPLAPLPPLANRFYSHGSFMGAAPALLASPPWAAVLEALMPDVFADVVAAVSSRGATRSASVSGVVMAMLENNPVLAAFGASADPEWVAPVFEWDVFIDPALFAPDSPPLPPQRILHSLVIAHGAASHLVAEHFGFTSYASVASTRKTAAGGVAAADWLDLMRRALDLAPLAAAAATAPGDLAAADLAAALATVAAEPRVPGDATFLKVTPPRLVVPAIRAALGDAPLALVLDVKSFTAPPDVLQLVVDACIDVGIDIAGVGSFRAPQISSLTSTTPLYFFHFAGDLQAAAASLPRSASVLFNVGSLIEYSRLPSSSSSKLASYSLNDKALDQLADLKQAYALHIGLYTQESDLDFAAARIIFELADARPDLFDLGLAWGGLAAAAAADILPSFVKGTIGTMTQGVVGKGWSTNTPDAQIVALQAQHAALADRVSKLEADLAAVLATTRSCPTCCPTAAS
ncbi:uncharacterized protein AMSG_04833 [Thecamonas trahens ATCC 50062]|uniref:Uncharacterized protein n=1 Tax=Thecamonas trahens ATCC 50062 TaxID=461836 RepID=A0A0L0D7Q0_THETB|nr:hypothetical protein AMSG_04833 [Thecamonas trahens ATCC 50062]KNC48384.1 hypothetical protein AMSG_04833 [Thecamonas trahens ATCC 50062]|eukprot:XP_013758501.1 hypothetical protein AMSG_04833 [Thecamonas trahens ATCC 50062]